MNLRRALFLTCCALLLCTLGSLHAVDRFSSDTEVFLFVGLVLAAGCAYMGAAYWFDAVSPDNRKLLVWLLALGTRLAVLTVEPGDDFWRYLWEGRVQREGHNPYLEAPDSAGLAKYRDQKWEGINHKDWAAIYPPIAEWSFAAIGKVSENPIWWKTMFALADLSVIWVLSRLLTGAGRWRTIVWYAWNPAIALAFAGHAHFDSLLLMALAFATWALHRADPMSRGKVSWRWATASAFFLGIAIGIKSIPLLVVPIWAFAMRGRWPLLLAGIVPVLVASVPFGGPEVVWGSTARFANVARFNDLAWWMLEDTIWPNPGGRNLRYILLLLLAVAFLTWRFRHDWRTGFLWILGAMLILSPVLHPWYVTWILPFACWRKQRAWFILSLSVTCAFLSGQETPLWQAWEPNGWIRAAVILPPLLALFSAWRSRLKGTDLISP